MKLRNTICYSSLFLFILSLCFLNIKEQSVSAINNNSQNISYSDDFYVDYEEPSEGEASTTAFGDFTDLIDRDGTFENLTDLNMETYFHYMNTYMPNNVYGSCGIVALSLILSYFDSFYDDTLIPTIYEDKPNVELNENNLFSYPSPGLKSSPNTSSIELFKTLIDVPYYYQRYYDYYLIHKRNYFDILKFEEDLAQGLKTEDDRPEMSISLHEGTLKTFVENEFGSLFQVETESGYMYNGSNLNYTYNTNQNEITLSQRQSLLQEFSDLSEIKIKEFIRQGYPVFMNLHSEMYVEYDPIKNITTSEFDYKHAVVGYAINEDDEIICHFGYKNSGQYIPYKQFQINSSENYKYIVGYSVLIPNNLMEKHTRKYIINNLGYCGCGIHVHLNEKTYINSSKHETSCECGQLKYENHTSTIKNECCEGWPNFPTEPPTIPGVMA